LFTFKLYLHVSARWDREFSTSKRVVDLEPRASVNRST
jgi:hypothetical protein